MHDKFAIVSNVVPEICEALKKRSFKLIYTDRVDEFISYEQTHADMQCFNIGNTVFLLRECTKLIESVASNTDFKIVQTSNDISCDYPNNILLNAKIIGNNLIGKIDSIDRNLLDFCINRGYKLINVKQGYTACSCLEVDKNSVITTDESIYRTLKEHNIDVLKISNESIVLYGAKRGECGFIGGASVNLGDEILFFGDITVHPEYRNISDFCINRNIKVSYISDMPLTDVGGTILLNISQSRR